MPRHLTESGNQTIGGNLNISGYVSVGYKEASTNYSISSTDSTINCISGSLVIQLPTASGIAGRRLDIKNSSSGTITVSGYSAETIDGGLYATLNNQWESITIQATSTSSWIIL